MLRKDFFRHVQDGGNPQFCWSLMLPRIIKNMWYTMEVGTWSR